MICPEFDSLAPIDKSIYLGKVVHAIQNDSTFFHLGNALIASATKKGLFEKVAFHPSEYVENNIDNSKTE